LRNVGWTRHLDLKQNDKSSDDIMQPSIPIGTIGLLLLYFANTFLFHFIKVTLYPSTFIICIHVDVWAYPLGVRKWSHTLGFTSNALNKRIRSSVRDFWLTFAKHSAMDSPPSTGLQGLLLQTQQCEGPWVVFKVCRKPSMWNQNQKQ
jgi:hypothetical protein